MDISQDPMRLRRPSPAWEYSARIPSLPPVSLPMPVMEQNPALKGINIGPIYEDPTCQEDQNFLFDNKPLKIQGVGVRDWKYEHRRDIQAIMPFLSIGPVSALRNVDYLRKQNITMLVGIKPSDHSHFISNPARRVAKELDVPLIFFTADQPFQLTAQYPEAARTINQHLTSVKNQLAENPSLGIAHGKVLIFCDSGNQKSASLAAAYLMETFEDVDYMKAMQILMSLRFCCDFEEVYRQSLKNYDDVIRARRQVHSQVVAPPAFGRTAVLLTKQKRGHDESEDEEGGEDGMAWEAASKHFDNERFDGRRFAPFVD